MSEVKYFESDSLGKEFEYVVLCDEKDQVDDIPNYDDTFSTWRDFFYKWNSEYSDQEKPKYLYGTYSEELKIYAEDVIDRATQDFYEDADLDISEEAAKELQDFLDKWCKTCGVKTNYYVDLNKKVKIPWEKTK